MQTWKVLVLVMTNTSYTRSVLIASEPRLLLQNLIVVLPSKTALRLKRSKMLLRSEKLKAVS